MSAISKMASLEVETKESTTSSPEILPPFSADNVRVMLLNSKQDHVLMQRGHDRWDLPYFVFPWGLNDEVAKCCMLFQSLLGFDLEVPLFAAVVELLGQIGSTHAPGYGNPMTFGFSKLLLIEPRIGTRVKELPTGFEWKDVGFVASIDNDSEYDPSAPISYEAIVSIMRAETPLHELSPHPPFQPGWFQKASDWLVAKIIEHGASPVNAPVQHMLSHTSAVLRVESTQGSYFLKGVAAGSSEAKITNAMVDLWPQCTPELISISQQFQAFVTRGFEEGEIDPHDYVEMLRIFGTLQKESVQHVEDLIAAGVPTFLLQDLEETLRGWAEDDDFARGVGSALPRFIKLIPKLVEMLKRLDEYNLPMCMVHGDFARRNIGFKEYEGNKERMLLHDWQFGAISHPFFDFHDTSIEWGGSIDVYLGMWGEYVSLKKAREAYELSKILGHLLKMRGSLDCLRKEVVQRKFGFSMNAAFCHDCFLQFEREVQDWAEQQQVSHENDSRPNFSLC